MLDHAGFLALGAIAIVLIVPAVLVMLAVFFVGAGLAAGQVVLHPGEGTEWGA